VYQKVTGLWVKASTTIIILPPNLLVSLFIRAGKKGYEKV
jgi:hypothetical protein